ncbi:MAG: oxalate/formate MFS antiporter [Afipia sp.]|nr:oxalate/formate MFS antiporter [Afipia sp.]
MRDTTNATRWLQLLMGVLCMVTIANMQYGWTLFVSPIDEKFHWGRPAIQTAFTIFILAETWLVPIESYFIDRIGPKITVAAGGVMVGLAWVINSIADSLFILYVGAAVGGLGAGIVYSAAIGLALKWFPDRRGLASGLTSAGFGVGSALTVVPIANMIQASGYQQTFLYFGIAQGLIVLLIAPFLRFPNNGETPIVKLASNVDLAPLKTVTQPIFWLLYFIFGLVLTGGLMATAQLAPIANDLKIAGVPVTLLGLTLPALSFALTLDRILNGLTRPMFGFVSDRLGRENTMFVAFSLEAAAIMLLAYTGHNPVMFVIASALVFFLWGEIFTLFPAMCTDLFGSKFATTNYGMLYTAKGVAALLIPIGSILVSQTGSWTAVFLVAASFNILASVLSLFVLKPMRLRMHKRLAMSGSVADITAVKSKGAVA